MQSAVIFANCTAKLPCLCVKSGWHAYITPVIRGCQPRPGGNKAALGSPAVTAALVPADRSACWA